MTPEEFEQIFDDFVDQSRVVLDEKAKEYADDNDRLHNFQAASALIGGTPEQALWGFAVKHLVSISDMVRSGQAYSQAQWDEKLGDALNYLILLYAQVKETSRRNEDVLEDSSAPHTTINVKVNDFVTREDLLHHVEERFREYATNPKGVIVNVQ